MSATPAAKMPGSSAGTAMPRPRTGRATACVNSATMSTAVTASQPSLSWAIRYADSATGTSAPPTLTAIVILVHHRDDVPHPENGDHLAQLRHVPAQPRDRDVDHAPRQAGQQHKHRRLRVNAETA